MSDDSFSRGLPPFYGAVLSAWRHAEQQNTAAVISTLMLNRNNALLLTESNWNPEQDLPVGRNTAAVQQIAHEPVVLSPVVAAARHVMGAQRAVPRDSDTARCAKAHRSTA